MDMDTARQIAARIWGDPEYQHIPMNPDVAENIALLLADWARACGDDDPKHAQPQRQQGGGKE